MASSNPTSLRPTYQYLYNDGSDFVFMDSDLCRVGVSTDLMGDDANFLLEGMTVKVVMFEGRVIGVAARLRRMRSPNVTRRSKTTVTGDQISDGRNRRQLQRSALHQ